MTAREGERPGLAGTKGWTKTAATGTALSVRSHKTGPDRVNDPSRELRKGHAGGSNCNGTLGLGQAARRGDSAQPIR